MDEFIKKVTLAINGKEITDFDDVEVEEVEEREAVELANKTGYCETTPRYKIRLKYAPPKGSAPFDFKGVVNGTLTIDTGVEASTENYKGVTYLKKGNVTKGKEVAMQDIHFIAEGPQ